MTRDDDYVQSFLVAGRPRKLLIVSTGNVANDELETIVRAHLHAIVRAFKAAVFVEPGRDSLTIHE